MAAAHPLADRAARAAVRLVAVLPRPLTRALAGPLAEIDGQRVHPEVALALRALNAGGPTFETKPLEQGRAELAAEAWIFGSRPACDEVRDIAIPSEDGHEIGARLFRADRDREPEGLLVYFHGGGFVLGGHESCEAMCRALARRTGLVVVSIDYRLAPEHPYPAAVRDGVEAFRWLRDRLPELGVRTGRIAVAGESAGGNLAAVVSLATALDPEGGPGFQCPIFPVADWARRSRSYELFGEGWFLTAAQMDWYRERYLRPEQLEDPLASPLYAPLEQLARVAPACVVTAGFDPLRDEGRAYAQRLADAGVAVRHLEFRGFIHAFVNATGLGRSVTRRIDRIGDVILEGMRDGAGSPARPERRGPRAAGR